MAIRALVFDLWGTLIEDVREHGNTRRGEVRVRLLLEALAVAGRPVPEEDVRDAFPPFIAKHGVMQGEGRDLAIAEKVAWFLDDLEPGLAASLPRQHLDRVEEAFVSPGRLDPPPPTPGAREALQEARSRGLRTGLVSNTGFTPGYVLRELLVEHGLREHLEVLTFSDEARLAKPAPEIFACTLDALGVAPDEAVFIGDMPVLDVQGPRKIGMWTVQVGARATDGIEPHARIDTLHGLFASLAALGLLED